MGEVAPGLPLEGREGRKGTDEAYGETVSPERIGTRVVVEVLEDKADHEAGTDVDREGADGKPLPETLRCNYADEVTEHGTEGATEGNEQVSFHAQAPVGASLAE